MSVERPFNFVIICGLALLSAGLLLAGWRSAALGVGLTIPPLSLLLGGCVK